MKRIIPRIALLLFSHSCKPELTGIFKAINENNLDDVKKFVTADKNVLKSTFLALAPGSYNSVSEITPLFYALRFALVPERYPLCLYLIEQIDDPNLFFWKEEWQSIKTKKKDSRFNEWTALTYIAFSTANSVRDKNAAQAINKLFDEIIKKSPLQSQGTFFSKNKVGNTSPVITRSIPLIFLVFAGSTTENGFYPALLNRLIELDSTQLKRIMFSDDENINKKQETDLWGLLVKTQEIGDRLNIPYHPGIELAATEYGPQITTPFTEAATWLLDNGCSPFTITSNKVLISRKLNEYSEIYATWLASRALTEEALRSAGIENIANLIKKKYPDAAQQFANIMNTTYKNKNGVTIYAFPKIGADPHLASFVELAGDKVDKAYFTEAHNFAQKQSSFNFQENLEWLDNAQKGNLQSASSRKEGAKNPPVDLSQQLQALANSLKALL